MKKVIALTVLILTVLTSTVCAEWVNGYTRRDGTYVNGYHRSNANSTVTDNYSYYGNTNPYTGTTGTKRYRSNSIMPVRSGGLNSNR